MYIYIYVNPYPFWLKALSMFASSFTMPHKRAKKKINGVPNVKLPHEVSAALVAASSVSTDASLLDESQCLAAEVLNAPSVLLDVNSLHSANLDSFRCPDMNPVLDCLQLLDEALFALAIKNAECFADFAPSLRTFSSPSSLSTSSPGCPAASDDCSPELVCSPEVASDCRHVLQLLHHLSTSFLVFEAEFDDEVEYFFSPGVADDWPADFVSSCFLEYQSFFEHFCPSSVPRVIDFYSG
jgi:hypothetical protein